MLQLGLEHMISVLERAKIFRAFYSAAIVIRVLSFFVDYFTKLTVPMGDARERSWLRHYAASRKVAGSIPDEVNGFFN
jgi:hypothetical protein